MLSDAIVIGRHSGEIPDSLNALSSIVCFLTYLEKCVAILEVSMPSRALYAF